MARSVRSATRLIAEPVVKPIVLPVGGVQGRNIPARPAAFVADDWTLTGGNALASVHIVELPDDGGSTITDIEYAVDGGAWASSGGTVDFDITGLINGVEVSVEIRAVSANGAGPVSDTKSATPLYTFTNPEAEAIVAAMTTEPSQARQALIDTTVGSLKTAGIWDKLDCLYVMAAHTAQAARLNWKAPATFALTPINSPAFTVDKGYASDGSTSYLSSGFSPSTNGVNWTVNQTSVFARLMDNMGSGGSSRALGSVDASNVGRSDIRPRTSSDQLEGAIGGGEVMTRANTVTAQLFAIDRSGTATKNTYIAGVVGTTAVVTDTPARPTRAVMVLAYPIAATGAAGSFLPSGISAGMVAWGGHLSSPAHANMNTALNAYIAGL